MANPTPSELTDEESETQPLLSSRNDEAQSEVNDIITRKRRSKEEMFDDAFKNICKERLTIKNCSHYLLFILIGWILLTGLSFITLQYVPHRKPSNNLRIPVILLYITYAVIGTTLLGLLINTYPAAVILTDWSTCPIQYFKVCYLMILHNTSIVHVNQTTDELPNIIMRDTNIDPSKY